MRINPGTGKSTFHCYKSAITVLSAVPVAIVGTVTTAPADVWTVFRSPFTVTVLPFVGTTVVPAGTRTDSPLVSVIDCPGASVFKVTGMDRDCVAVKAGLDESETLTLKVLVPAVVGVPEITPELRAKPGGSVPLETDQV